MIPALAALLTLVAAAGVWIAILGATGVPTRTTTTTTRPAFRWERLWTRGGLAVAAAVVGWWATGWPAVGALGAAAAGIVPMLAGVRKARDEVSARSEALAAWAEMLRDTISAHAGLREAISLSARVAPRPIRTQVQALAVRAERENLAEALQRFAVEVGDPVADLIVAALVIGSERQAQRLPELLSHIARSAREQSSMRSRVETGRARTYASSKWLVGLTFSFAVGLMVFAPTFMKPFDTVAGQLMLLLIGGLFAGALWTLVHLGRPASVPRLLAGIEDHR